MIILDTNVLVLWLVGLIDPSKISKIKRSSMFDAQDHKNLSIFIAKKTNNEVTKIITLPNIWTEVDHLLNNSFSKNEKWEYIRLLKNTIQQTTEKFFSTYGIIEHPTFFVLGITDTVLLACAKAERCAIISMDDELINYAKAYNLEVYNLIALKNEQLKRLQ